MARLNEPIGHPESVDALKRRFVRQNREIARVNSLQSLRIRSLESEVSHLLAENVSLREQNIALNQDIARLEATSLLRANIDSVKAKLEAKLGELNDLVLDLVTIPQRLGKKPEDIATFDKEETKTSAPTGHAGISDWSAGEQSRLPPILEDKCFPRNTLDVQDFQELLEDGQNVPPNPGFKSPQLEPHAPTGEIYEIELQKQGDACNNSIDTPGSDEMKETVFVDTPEIQDEQMNISNEIERGWASLNSQSSSSDTGFPPPKAGSKRKYDPDEEDTAPIAISTHGDFKFSRPSGSGRNLEDVLVQLSDMSTSPQRLQLASLEERSRKALGPKTANSHLTSPRKLNSDAKEPDRTPRGRKRKTGMKENKISGNQDCRSLDKITSDDILEILQESDVHSREQIENQEICGFSVETQPNSSSPRGYCRSVPDLDLQSVVSRPSRRQRSVMSYAEPNLRDKMRRPTKAFVDAVGGQTERRISSSQSPQAWMIDEGAQQRSGKRSSDISNNSSAQDMDFVSRRKRGAVLTKHGESLETLEGTRTTTLDDIGANVRKKSAAETRELVLGRDTTPASDSLVTAGIEDDHIAHMSPRNEKKGARRQSRRHSSKPASTDSVESLRRLRHPRANEHTGQIQEVGKSPEDKFRIEGAKMDSDSFLFSSGAPERDTIQARRASRVPSRRNSMML
ncbi:hypothetical protein ASPZODRAFT_137577 [Penicilliopsis zonata CBS 506.65]|uniref:Shugoshin C-terminal domain-containing protein n=1 Tax=Penicilliopsis zonata CBS 506.65 TaxID=1073090 RepID=A0A1L9S4A6_9EURO|nr:hypothetical protein ASPZODRAFT_137577 [Penicilliopsis zonata CBS 506.65]OJJ42000.1 hypothetical protein ASPZODRAFT_137577 [Penicilliopsis zonata CBS 506.65]